MRLSYVYDREGWALHNIGLFLASELSNEMEIRPISAGEFVEARPTADVTYLSFSGLDHLRALAKQLSGSVITTVHDPEEISFFTDRFSWERFPLRHRSALEEYDRISVTSREMKRLLESRYMIRSFLTPTFPHDGVEPLPAGMPRDVGPVIRLFSATNKRAVQPFRQVLARLPRISEYLTDETGKINLKQLRAIGIRTNRKNVKWLEAIESHFAGDPRVEMQLRRGDRTSMLSRSEYLGELNSSDVYICTSFMEGGPLPVMEAVRAGKAVLTTRVGQVEEWVRDGQNGYLCSSLEEFLAAVEGYVQDPELLRHHQALSEQTSREAKPDLDAWRHFLSCSTVT